MYPTYNLYGNPSPSTDGAQELPEGEPDNDSSVRLRPDS